MATSINHVHIIGNLTRDPELRTTTSGGNVMNMSVAVNDNRQNRDTGEWESYPNYIDVVMFDGSGNRLWMLNYLKKGQRVVVDGRLHYSSWEKDGQKRSKVCVYASTIEPCGYPRKDDTQRRPGDGARQQRHEAKYDYDYDESIPF